MFSINALPVFLLVFVRVTCFFLVLPVFSNKQIPATFKIGLSFFIAMIGFAVVGQDVVAFDHLYILILLKECLVGLGLGFVAAVFFYAIQVSGTFIDLQNGLGMAALFDPSSGTNVALTGRFKMILTMLFMLSVDGHHLLIQGVIMSYEWVSVSEWTPALFDGRFSFYLLTVFKNMFLVAFLIATPFVVAMFLVDVTLGILAKASPQMNLIVVGFPIKIMVHFMILFLVVPGFLYLLKTFITDMIEHLSQVIQIIGV